MPSSIEAAAVPSPTGVGLADDSADTIDFEPIAPPGYRLDQPLTIVGKCPPQFADTLDQHIIRDGNVRPNRSEQILLRHKSAGIFDEETQHGQSLWPQNYFAVVKKQTTTLQIQDIAIELQSPCT